MDNAKNIRLLVVGGASLDRLDGAEQLVAGGAGMYTAMAAARSGAAVSLYAPRPEPVPGALHPVAESVTWLGPTVAPEELAHFEINHDGGEAKYVTANFGAEASLSPDGLPDDLSAFDCVHLIPLGDLQRQLEFMTACRQRGARRISAGTALLLMATQPDAAAAVMDGSDYFFMNEAEAAHLFGSERNVMSRPGQTFFVTRGSEGALVVQGGNATAIAGSHARVVDPTGAGDTFCGATLAGIATGLHPVLAARRAVPLAARMTEQVGPGALIQPRSVPAPNIDERVTLNAQAIDAVAQLIGGQPEISAYPFTGPDLPPQRHAAALDFFFVTALQQFGFWTSAGNRYKAPLVATIDGEERKGAFYLFRACMRWAESAPERLTPAGQAQLTETDLRELFRADDGSEPMPALDLHLELARQYGEDMLALGLTPQAMLETANASTRPLQSLLRQLDHVGGYKEDPLRKKSALLAMILMQRPERFLATADEDVPPVVDYHVMRSCLRMGLVDVVDANLENKLVGRELLAADEEWAVRAASHRAVEQLVAQSGKSMGAVDWFFFQARQRCPEMSPPRCSECAVDAACAHRVELFQPVIRTTFY